MCCCDECEYYEDESFEPYVPPRKIRVKNWIKGKFWWLTPEWRQERRTAKAWASLVSEAYDRQVAYTLEQEPIWRQFIDAKRRAGDTVTLKIRNEFHD